MSRVQEEIVAWVRRRSSAFSRGRSRFRGVSGQAGHWEARIGTFGDRKNVRFPLANICSHLSRVSVLYMAPHMPFESRLAMICIDDCPEQLEGTPYVRGGLEDTTMHEMEQSLTFMGPCAGVLWHP